MRKSLRGRLALTMAAGMILLMAAGNGMVYLIYRQLTFHAFDQSLLKTAQAAGAMIRLDRFGLRVDHDALTQLIDNNKDYPLLYHISLDQSAPAHLPPANRSGRRRHSRNNPHPILHSLPATRPASSPRPIHFPFRRPTNQSQPARPVRMGTLDNQLIPFTDRPTDQPVLQSIKLPNGNTVRAAVWTLTVLDPSPRRANRQGQAHIAIAGIRTPIHRQLSRLAWVLAGISIGAVALAALLAWHVAGWGMRPLRALTEQVAALDAHSLDQPIQLHEPVPTELTGTINQLNQLLHRLNLAFEKERTMTADLAHELRNPLAAMLSITQVSLARPREPEAYRQAIEQLQHTTRQLSQMAERLLTLSRIESGQVQANTTALQPNEQLTRHWRTFEARARERQVHLDLQCPVHLWIHADPGLFDLIWSNLLANAVNYCPCNGTISLNSHIDTSHLILSCTNPNTDLTPEDTGHLTQRFWRKATARTNPGSHCGLGLTMVQRAAEAENLPLDFQISPETFTAGIRYPLAATPADG